MFWGSFGALGCSLGALGDSLGAPLGLLGLGGALGWQFPAPAGGFFIAQRGPLGSWRGYGVAISCPSGGDFEQGGCNLGGNFLP